ncbi:alpha/beta fold hydrolase [Mycetocola saprophilus]|uniref:alpha/beta fold hydrolase n=1 Tax=Mycetocola saprophilus TaxID=76636 RepID=UPI003BEF9E12
MNTSDIVSARLGEIFLPDGRALGFAEYGTSDGTPVLFIPGAASGRAMNFGAELLSERAIRLISVDRPGLGASDHDPDKSLTSVAEDLRYLLSALGLGRIPLIANSQGAPFALALAATGAVSSLNLVSPSDEVAHPLITGMLPEEMVTLIDSVGREPETVRAHFARFTPELMWEYVMSEISAADAEVYGDEEFRALYRRTLAESFACGAHGYAADTILAMSPWRLPLDQIDIPVHVWFGDRDEVHSPDHGDTLTHRIPGAQRHLVSGAGGSLLWSEPGLFLGYLD